MSLASRLLVIVAASAVAACGTIPKDSTLPASPGKYYKDDGPGDNPPANLDAIPDAIPRAEPLHRAANRPYTVFGRDYVPATSLRPYRERGMASWYGRRFHGEKTSTGETYDMYAMTAAHPTLPLPSYARVTSVASGKSVVVRVNDRGPFLHNRLIDLSFAAASRIGIAQTGSGEVEVEAILPVAAPTLVAAAPLPAVSDAPIAAPIGAPAGAAPLAEGPTVPVTTTDGSFVVQLGAFASYANAQNFVARLANQIAPVGVEAKIRQVNGLYRAFVGPFASRDDAKRITERLRDAFGLPSTIAIH